MSAVLISRELLILASVIFLFLGGYAAAQETLGAVLTDLRAVQANENASIEELREATFKVQRIIDEFPASDAAVSVLLGETYDGIDFAAFEERLKVALGSQNTLDQAYVQSNPHDKEVCLASAVADKPSVNMLIGFSVSADGDLSDLPEMIEPEPPSSEARLQYLQIVAALEECSPYGGGGDGTPFQLKISETGALSLAALTVTTTETGGDLVAATAETIAVMPVGSERTEKLLGLDKQAIRDIQARLLVIGHNPNGVDGVVGKGTRSAIRAWQGTVNAAPTGYLNELQLIALKEQSQNTLDEWLRSDDNAKLYKPPPVLALGPRNMSGNWRYTTNCGSGSRLGRMKITGTLAMQHAGGRNYAGTLSNSQGLRGRVSATLRGRSVSAVTNFGLLIGKVTLKARVDDYKLVLRGRDSNGCSFYASKR